MKQLIKSMFHAAGLEITKKNKQNDNVEFDFYDYKDDALQAYNMVKHNTMMAPINLVTLYEQAVYCEINNIEGDFVECGVWKGGAVGVMAIANKNYSQTERKLHLFDVFDDICEPNPKVDGKRAIDDVLKFSNKNESDITGKVEAIKGIYDIFGGHGTVTICNELLVNKIGYHSDNIIYHIGWFQDTIPAHAHDIEKIAILRLDGDWYDSIKIPLQYLYPKVVSGGIIIIDDYGYYEGCTKAVNEYLAENNIVTFLSYNHKGSRYFIKS